MVRKGEKVKGIGALHVLCAQDSVFRIATSPIHIVIVFFLGVGGWWGGVGWGWMGVGGLLPQPPDLCDLQYMCTCSFDLLIWVPGCCVCQLDKKMTGFCTFFLLSLRAGSG